MSFEFRVTQHSILSGTQMVECWRDGKFVAGIYPHQDGIRIVSKYMTDMSNDVEPVMAGGDWLPSVTIKLGEKPVSV